MWPAGESDRGGHGRRVNDAPALNHADVAVAMGSGTAVAREAADLVLGDDSFATLMNGLREGRRIIANVQKGLTFLLSTHVALLGFILIATIAGFSQPLLPIQILWTELFIDLSASVAFEREPEAGRHAAAASTPDAALLDRGILIGTGPAAGSPPSPRWPSSCWRRADSTTPGGSPSRPWSSVRSCGPTPTEA